jgi:hypothetical protein
MAASPRLLLTAKATPGHSQGNASTEKISHNQTLLAAGPQRVAHLPSRTPRGHEGCDNSFKPMKHFDPEFPDSYPEAETPFTDRRTGDQTYRCRIHLVRATGLPSRAPGRPHGVN